MSSTSGRPPRRMLPSVTDVVNELSRAVQADPAVLFKVSRQVVAEELGRVKQGFESASIEILAKRARRLLDPGAVSEMPVAPPPAPKQSSLFSEQGPPAASPVAAAATPQVPPVSPEDPFSPSSEKDLGWEKEIPIQADDAPFRSAILPIPRSRMPAGIGAPDASAPQAVPAVEPPVAPPASAPAPRAASPEPAPPAEFELAEESKPAATPLPPPPAGARPSSAERPVLSPAPVSKPDSAAFPRSPAPAVPSAPPPIRPEERPAFVRSDTRPAFEPPPPPDERQPIRPPEEAGSRAPGRITTREWKALGDIGIATERLADSAPPPASRETVSVDPAPPAKPSGRGRSIAVIAILVGVALAAGAAWFLRDMLFGRVATKPESPVAARPARATPVPPTPPPATPTAMPAASAQKSGAAQKAAAKTVAPPSPDAARVRPAGTASGWSKGSLIVSKEWSGKATIWVIHFSSHKDRAGAEKEAARLAAALSKTGHAIEVDLGEKGIWYRVLIGDFATPDEARAFHAELEAKNTPNLGFVYQLRGE